MRIFRSVVLVSLVCFQLHLCNAEDFAKTVRKAVEKSTLDQPGTQPFHLVADLAPSRDRDKDSGRTGTIEIWWVSPTKWRREIRSPQFHQLLVVDGEQRWQKNDGQYFPEWLREISVELVSPVPDLPMVLNRLKTAELRRMMGQSNLDWEKLSGPGNPQANAGGVVSIKDATGLLLYDGGLGWGGSFHDYAQFQGRMVVRKVSLGTPEVTAQIKTLEDLGAVAPDFFNATAPGSDKPILTVFVSQQVLEALQDPMPPIVWPTLQDGTLEGGVTSTLEVDRNGNPRDVNYVVSENSGVNEAGLSAFRSMHFKPYLLNGEPVQVVASYRIPFKTTRPAGTETFASAREYFEHSRQLGFPAFGNGSAYLLKAEFESGTKSGKVETGFYTDTWMSATQWRREASIGASRLVKSRDGDKYYLDASGDDAPLLRFVFRIIEPIPAIDTFVESDWRIKRDTVDGTATVRVLTGPEEADGKLDTKHARAFWFNASGDLVKTFFTGVDSRRTDFEDYEGVRLARVINVFMNGSLAMHVHILTIGAAPDAPQASFKLDGHEWVRQFTDEVR